MKLGKRIGEGAHGSVHEGTWSNVHGGVSKASCLGEGSANNLELKILGNKKEANLLHSKLKLYE